MRKSILIICGILTILGITAIVVSVIIGNILSLTFGIISLIFALIPIIRHILWRYQVEKVNSPDIPKFNRLTLLYDGDYYVTQSDEEFKKGDKVLLLNRKGEVLKRTIAALSYPFPPIFAEGKETLLDHVIVAKLKEEN